MILGPPGEPVTKTELAVAHENGGSHGTEGAFARAIALASDWIKPKSVLGTPGCVVKSSISSLRRKPADVVSASRSCR